MKIPKTYTIEEETIKKLQDLKKSTRVPVSQYIEEAIDDLLKKYKKEE